MNRFKSFSLVLFLTLVNCSKNLDNYASQLNGYWEISQVKQDHKLVKEFTINSVIDYWQIENDTIGFRKKVKPDLDGKISVTNHSIPFVIKIENNNFNLYYTDNGAKHMETVVKISQSELVITNNKGLVYTYVPYEPLDLSNE